MNGAFCDLATSAVVGVGPPATSAVVGVGQLATSAVVGVGPLATSAVVSVAPLATSAVVGVQVASSASTHCGRCATVMCGTRRVQGHAAGNNRAGVDRNNRAGVHMSQDSVNQLLSDIMGAGFRGVAD